MCGTKSAHPGSPARRVDEPLESMATVGRVPTTGRCIATLRYHKRHGLTEGLLCWSHRRVWYCRRGRVPSGGGLLPVFSLRSVGRDGSASPSQESHRGTRSTPGRLHVTRPLSIFACSTFRSSSSWPAENGARSRSSRLESESRAVVRSVPPPDGAGLLGRLSSMRRPARKRLPSSQPPGHCPCNWTGTARG